MINYILFLLGFAGLIATVCATAFAPDKFPWNWYDVLSWLFITLAFAMMILKDMQ